MNMLLNLESPVTTSHRAKLASIYVRQSTAGQVRQHQESTELQYRLVDRAAAFGWPKERIEVIDDDLGKSGTSSEGRGGFASFAVPRRSCAIFRKPTCCCRCDRSTDHHRTKSCPSKPGSAISPPRKRSTAKLQR